jgi:hypothetical protein
MTKITYEIVEHDGGWAYRVDGVFSEPFPSHDLARRAAERAAREQIVPGETTPISYWRPAEIDPILMSRDDGNVRPQTIRIFPSDTRAQGESDAVNPGREPVA